MLEELEAVTTTKARTSWRTRAKRRPATPLIQKAFTNSIWQLVGDIMGKRPAELMHKILEMMLRNLDVDDMEAMLSNMKGLQALPSAGSPTAAFLHHRCDPNHSGSNLNSPLRPATAIPIDDHLSLGGVVGVFLFRFLVVLLSLRLTASFSCAVPARMCELETSSAHPRRRRRPRLLRQQHRLAHHSQRLGLLRLRLRSRQRRRQQQ